MDGMKIKQLAEDIRGVAMSNGWAILTATQTKQSDYESLNGPITHEYPFVGTDEERVRYTSKMNKLLEEKSIENGYIYFNPYSYYTRLDGTLKFDFSDSTVHLRENSYFLEKFIELQL